MIENTGRLDRGTFAGQDTKPKGLPPAVHRQQALSAAWTILRKKLFMYQQASDKPYTRLFYQPVS